MEIALVVYLGRRKNYVTLMWCFESTQNCTSFGGCNFENFQNIASDHKSQNVRAGSHDFLFLIFSTKLLKRTTLFSTRYVQHKNASWSIVSKMLTYSIWTKRKNNTLTENSSSKFLRIFETTQKISRNLNLQFFKSEKGPQIFFFLNFSNSITQSTSVIYRL